jgi:uncharacterized protein
MRSRFLWSCALIVTAGLMVPACRSKLPEREPRARAELPRKRAIVPLEVLNDHLAICRTDRDRPLPSWAKAAAGEFISVTRTRDELSIIVSDPRAPSGAKCERDWRPIMVKGPLDFNQVGIIAGLSGTLADAGISIFALSTYDTDYIMVKQGDLDRALATLRDAGYSLSQSRSS